MADRPKQGPGAHGDQDIDAKTIAWSGAAFVLIAAITYVGVWGLYKAFQTRGRAGDVPALSLVESESPERSEPALQDGVGTASPVEEMAKWRAEEARRLEEWGWVDRDAGVVRIPVERAMRLVADRGLPYRGAAARPGSMPVEADGVTPEHPVEDLHQ